jgi:SAM-dependent methyltransferase
MIAQEILTHQSEITESSGYTLAGSFTRDLIASKIWLLQELEKIQRHYTTMYVLGSWYGNLALFMYLQPTIMVGTIINVEINPEMLRTSKQLLDLAGVDNVEFMLKDANKLNYQQLGDSGVVINTSLTEMPEAEWFEHIPAGTLVVMQARNNDPGVQYRESQDIQRRYPLSQVLYRGAIQLRDPETEYQRFMTIGRK